MHTDCGDAVGICVLSYKFPSQTEPQYIHPAQSRVLSYNFFLFRVSHCFLFVLRALPAAPPSARLAAVQRVYLYKAMYYFQLVLQKLFQDHKKLI